MQTTEDRPMDNDIEIIRTRSRLCELAAEYQQQGKSLPEPVVYATEQPVSPATMAKIILSTFYQVER